MHESGVGIVERAVDTRANELRHDSRRRVRIETRAMEVHELLHQRAIWLPENAVFEPRHPRLGDPYDVEIARR